MAPGRSQLVRVWLVSVTTLGALVGLSVATRTGGDDPDQGRQRPGILDLGPLPVAAPRLPGVTPGGHTTVVFFAGRRAEALCRALADPPAELAAAEVVVVAEDLECPPSVTAVPSPARRAGAAFGLPTPRDGGPPLGYAIVDRDGMIRYRTLDPEVDTLLHEVATMLRAVG